MSRSGGKSGKPARPIAPDEAELWSRVAQTVEKVKKKPRVPSHVDEVLPSPPVAPKAEPSPHSKSKPKPPRQSSLPAAPPPPPPRAPPLADFDRRTVRQVSAGKTAIDARLDLHGMRQADARGELRAFLRACQGKGFKTVLVITGKGGPAERDYLAGALGEPQRGVLRRAVPQWLQEPDMRAIVLSYTTAGPRHGGEGALYVQLRKPRRD